MPRRIVCSLAFAAAAAGLIWAGWRGAAANPATLVDRVDVIAAVVLLAGLPWLVRRVFGPPGGSRLARAVRVGGYAAVFVLVLAKAEVERSEFVSLPGRAWFAGVWTGEIVFLVVVAAYVAGLLAATARRPPFSPVALAIGTGAGGAAGLILYALPPLGSWLHITIGWLAVGYRVARVAAVPLVLGTAIAAGLAAARRTAGRRRQLPLADARARQGLAAGLCAGAAAALIFCVLSTGTVALLPHAVKPLEWVFTNPDHVRASLDNYNPALYQFEMSVADTAAGYLLALVCFPLLGAGLGAWGGLYAAGPSQGGGGGGGGPSPGPEPPPPSGGRRLGGDRPPAVLRGNYLVDFPVPGAGPAAPDDDHAAPRPATTPVGGPGGAARGAGGP
jgi:hypothetical protein